MAVDRAQGGRRFTAKHKRRLYAPRGDGLSDGEAGDRRLRLLLLAGSLDGRGSVGRAVIGRLRARGID